jgi:hypothetical protein
MAWDHLGIIRESRTESDGTTTERVPALDTTQRERENEILRWVIRAKAPWPLPVIPFEADQRMAVQQTVMTCVGEVSQPLEDLFFNQDRWHDQASEDPPGGYALGTDSTVWRLNEPGDVVLRIEISPEWRRHLLAVLATMNIDDSTLFPGLDGVGRATARQALSVEASMRTILTDSFP